MIKAVIFDCFGVLVQNGWKLLEETYSPSDEAWQEILSASHQADLGLLNRYELDQTIAHVLGVDEHEISELVRSQKVSEGMMSIIATLKSKNYKLAILSNVASGVLEQLIPKHHLDMFDELALSSTMGIVKPDERAYLRVANQLGLEPEECLFTDDAERNVTGAHNTGMQALLFEDLKKFEQELAVALSL